MTRQVKTGKIHKDVKEKETKKQKEVKHHGKSEKNFKRDFY